MSGPRRARPRERRLAPRAGLALVLALVLGLSACLAPEREPFAPPPAPADASLASEDAPADPAAPPADGAAAGTDAAGAGEAVPDGEGEPADDDLAITGSLITRFRRRSGDGDRDSDIHTLLSTQVGDPAKDAFTGSFVGRLSKDLDGGTSADNAFFGLNDTYDSSWRGRIYEAYVDANQIDGLEKLRIGRQALFETPEYVSFDGILAVTEPDEDLALQIGAYVGRPDHTYESDEDGDSLAGGFVQARPWRGGRVRLDAMRIEDALLLGEEQNHLTSVRIWQTFDRYLLVRGGYSRLEGEAREGELAATFTDPDNDLTLQASYREQFSTQRTLSTELDPFSSTLLAYAPFKHTRLIISKGLGEHWVVQGGGEVRRLDDESDEGAFNHEFERYHVTTIAKDVVAEEVDVALTGELWDSGDDDFATWGVDVTQQTTEDLRSSVGVSYARWKNDFLLDEEREHARTYYARLRYDIDERTTWTLGYAFEDNEIDTFHTVDARMSWRF